ncbi:uncharacterized protein [Antedon mediterranea]|uniref:uncharacterized protein n=1 Tax=Antedon mediterranea TaxID=105859 RepID=UPI003AF4603C
MDGAIEPGYIDRFSVQNDITLVVTNILRSDSGTYECYVSLVGDSPSADSDIWTLTVDYFDSCNSLLIDVNSFTAAHNVTITCSGSIDGNFVINLCKDENLIISQTTLPLTYVVEIVSENNTGIYRCEASNTVKTVSSNTLRLAYYLTGSVTINSTSNDTAIVVTCSGQIDGIPVPIIKLYKDGNIIQEQSALPLTYIIRSITENDDGSYTCAVSNTAVSTKSSVLELHKPIIEMTEDFTVQSGEKVAIRLNVNANPQDVTYVWISGVSDTDTNPETFTFTSPMDAGAVHAISVNVTNLIGSASKTIHITVTDFLPPESVLEESDEDVSDSTGLIANMVSGKSIQQILLY